MTCSEFSNEFDTILNSYSVNNTYEENQKADIILDEYEKSVFLTRAQEQLVIELYTGKSQSGEGFEGTEQLRRYLHTLIKTSILNDKLTGYIGLSTTSAFYQLPKDLWFITYESVIFNDDTLKCTKNNTALVVPITQDEYFKVSKNPFRGPSKNRVLRLEADNKIIELISKYNIDTYLVRYIIKPKPIILTDLSTELSINGISTKSECELNPVFHRAILERAAQLAIASKTLFSGNK